MSAIAMPKKYGLALLSAVCIPSASIAQAPVDIVRIWQNFIVSRVVAERCHALDDDTDIHFLANLLDVRIRANQALQERNPSTSRDEIGLQMKSAEESIANKVGERIKANGCDSAEFQQWLAMYKMHSTMKF